MPHPIVSDQEFLELWATHQSAKKIAKVLDCAITGVHARRRRLEGKYGKTLQAKAPQAQFYKHLSPQEHPHRKHLECGTGKVIVFSDAHFWPGVRTTAFRALLQFARELKPDAIVNNGDAFDGASISRFPRIGWDSKPSVIEELHACRDRLMEIQSASGHARLFWPLGNHDARFETRLAANAPQYEGVHGFHLKDHFPAWVPCWSLWINGDVVIKHRLRGGVHAVRNNTLNAGKTTVTGHLHQLKVTPLDDYSGTRWGVDTGTLADPRGPQFVDYLEDSFVDWRSGFVVLTFWKGRLLWPEIVSVIDETHVDFRGHVIEVPQ
jgi:hypothetical protein